MASFALAERLPTSAILFYIYTLCLIVSSKWLFQHCYIYPDSCAQNRAWMYLLQYFQISVFSLANSTSNTLSITRAKRISFYSSRNLHFYRADHQAMLSGWKTFGENRRPLEAWGSRHFFPVHKGPPCLTSLALWAKGHGILQNGWDRDKSLVR